MTSSEQKETITRLEHLVDMKAGANPGQKARLLRMVEVMGVPLLTHSLNVNNIGAQRQYGETNVMDLATTARATAQTNDNYGSSDNPYVVSSSKHGNLVVLAIGGTQLQAFKRAMAADAQSPFGGFFGFNTPVEPETAAFISNLFIEGTVAPGYEGNAAEILRTNGSNRFILERPTYKLADFNGPFRYKAVDNILMEQTPFDPNFDLLTKGCVVAGNNGNYEVSSLDPEIVAAAQFGVNALSLITSNTVLFSTQYALIGIGNGVGNRYQAARNARANMEASLYMPGPTPSFVQDMDELHAERALYDTPFDPKQFEDVIMEATGLRVAGCSDAFYPAPDALIETLGIDRLDSRFANGKLNLSYMTSRGERKQTNILLPTINHDPDMGYSARHIPDVIVQPGGCDGDAKNRAIVELAERPMIFTMSVDQYKERLDTLARGEKSTITGKRFFDHGAWS